MSKMKDTLEKEKQFPNEYKFDALNHIHTYLDKPLLGTSTVVGVIAKPLTWWASGLAVAKLGWISKGNAIKGWTPKELRIATAASKLFEIQGYSAEQYLGLLDEAYAAHSKKLTSSAKEGTDLHAELERFVKNTMANRMSVYDDKIMPFISWVNENVEKFLWSEIYCYSEKLWVGGISDCGVLLKNGKQGIIDFKSSKESYVSQFIQCAGYDIEISENGGFNAEGYAMFGLEKPLDFYAIVPFGASEFTVDIRYNVEELKKGFESAVDLYKLTNN